MNFIVEMGHYKTIIPTETKAIEHIELLAADSEFA